jgi:hypothetical protein
MDAAAGVAPERVLELSNRLADATGQSIGEIASINREAKMLAINAMITAARAGDAGRGFMVVAEEFQRISGAIDEVAKALESKVRADVTELSQIGEALVRHVRGQRLADLALNAIEIIDRNLYERTCDVRWWATDSAVVDCAELATVEAARHASNRLKIILEAYTVYLDLWICDASGLVLANGRPDRYRVVGSSVADADWFREALKTASGDEFVASDIVTSPRLQNAPVATYAAAIRRGAEKRGEVVGVLGIHFDWQPQAHAVVDGVRLTDDERACSRVMLLDRDGRILAASDRQGELEERFRLPGDIGAIGNYAVRDATIGYALTPGYETYRGMGWYGCIVQRTASAASPQPSERAA